MKISLLGDVKLILSDTFTMFVLSNQYKIATMQNYYK